MPDVHNQLYARGSIFVLRRSSQRLWRKTMTEVAPGRHRVFAYADLATLDPHLAGWCMIWGYLGFS